MIKTSYKIIFIGTSQFAVPALKTLIKEKYKIITVITSPDKPIGRKQEITSSPIKKTALEYNLKILQPEKISDIASKISDLKPDLIITAAYGQIIPKDILNTPKFNSLNLHPSLLPKYRGPSPIQTAILNNDKTTGLTIMLMDEKMDHGPIISQTEIKINDQFNYQTLEKKLSQEAATLLIKILPQYFQNEIKPKPQKEEKASYTKILTRQDGKINLQQTAKEIERKIRAFYPWPGTWTELNGKRIKILKAKTVNQENEQTIKTNQGFLELELVQPAGKKPMTGEEFFKGYKAKVRP